jgi:hypothetical protein
MKQRKMTKRQILNELLAVKEKQLKLMESDKRLQARKEKERAKRCELAEELVGIMYSEAKKNGTLDDFDEEAPIFFKDHVFEIETNVGYNNRTEVDIRQTKSVK